MLPMAPLMVKVIFSIRPLDIEVYAITLFQSITYLLRYFCNYLKVKEGSFSDMIRRGRSTERLIGCLMNAMTSKAVADEFK